MFVLSVVTEEKHPLNEWRRSVRLQESGYYNANGAPVISYNETPYRVFKKRKFHRVQASYTDSHEDKRTIQNASTVTEAETASSCCSHFWGKMLVFAIFMLFLASGYSYHACVTKLEQDIEAHSAYTRLLSIDADRMPNFAVWSKGARVIKGWSSDTYQPRGWAQMIQSWCCPKYMSVLQPLSPLVPGMCWPFAGDRGHLHVQLSDLITISHVTLGHIGKKQSPTGHISSAPREFSVYGLKTVDGEEKHLGTFVYDQSGPSFQTFALPDQEQTRDSYRHIKLQVNSNWGNTEYTCLYNIRVHGNVPVRSDIQ